MTALNWTAEVSEHSEDGSHWTVVDIKLSDQAVFRFYDGGCYEHDRAVELALAAFATAMRDITQTAVRQAERINAAAEAVRSDRYYVLVCRQCGPPPLPMPFVSAEERGKWAAEHTRGTGHDSWLVVDP